MSKKDFERVMKLLDKMEACATRIVELNKSYGR